MYLNMIRLTVGKQVHCLCKSQALPNCIRSLSEQLQSKTRPPYLLQVCAIKTSNYNQKEEVLEPNKSSLLEVYRGSISRVIYKVKAFSLMTSVFGLATQPIVLSNAFETETNTVLIVGACTFIGFFTFVTPILLHLLTKRYILRLEYCPKTDQYYASTYSFLLKNNVDKFSANDVFVPTIPGMLTTFEVNKKPYFIDKDSFLDLEHYKKIMGYDKPIDFKLFKPESVKKE